MRIYSDVTKVSWNQIWASVVESLKQIWNFWFSSSGQELPYFASFCFALIVLIVGILIIKLILRLVAKAFKIDKKVIKDKTVKSFLLSTLKIFLYFGLVLIFLSILRVELSGIATIFSSAILAVGLSLQDVISNFASGIIILSNKPFVVGDYISLNDTTIEGTVLDVRFLVTVLKTYDCQVITISNKTITNSAITNYTKDPLRRVSININFDYSADIEKIKKEFVAIASSDNRVMANPKPFCILTNFTNSGLSLSLKFYVPTDMYWDVWFDINDRIIKKMNEMKLVIPYNRITLVENK